MTRRVVLAALFVASGCFLFGQSDLNSITVTATRTIYSQADQVVFSVVVTSNADATLDSIVAALSVLGITAGNLSSTQVVGYSFGSDVQLNQLWAFTLPAPLSKLKDTIASLTTLQQTIAKKTAGLNMTFNIVGTQASPQPCSTTDLIADARTQAQMLANAAGVSVGPVIDVSDLSLASVQAYTNPTYAIPALLVGQIINAPNLPSNCSLVVQFRLVR